MRVEVYKCRFTGEIFEKDRRNEYIEHLKTLRKDMKAQRRYDQYQKKFETWIAAEKEKITSVNDIPEWIMKNQVKLMRSFNYLQGKWRSEGDRWHTATDKIELGFSNIHYEKCSSNSHVCPKNGVTNWGSDPSLPTGYPGYRFKITGHTTRAKHHMWYYPSTDLLRFIRIFGFAGGGGNDSWTSYATLFIEDWPGLEQEIMVKLIKGEKV